MKLPRPSLFAALVLALLPSGSQAQKPPNLVIVSLDTTRFDHLGLGGLPLPATPELDRLARESHVFTQARSVIPLTGPAHASIMTGLYPHAHGAIRNVSPLRQDKPTLAELLRAESYQTAGFVSGWTMRSQISAVHRGFEVWDQEMTDHYKVVHSHRHADQVTGRARAWLERRSDRPFFLFVHYFDAHDPYEEHSPWASDFFQAYWQRALPADQKTALKLAAYDSEIRSVDRQLGLLFETLARKGLLETTWIVVVADHGEAFGEHGYQRHGRRVHEPALHIAMLLRPPGGLPREHLIPAPVSQVDLMPAILEIFGLESPPAQGVSFAPLLHGQKADPRPPVRFETYTLWSLRRKKLPSKLGLLLGHLKIVFSPRNGSFEIYDLARDPRELANLASKHPELQIYRQKLLDWWRASRTVVEEPKLSAEDLERLRQLGYVN